MVVGRVNCGHREVLVVSADDGEKRPVLFGGILYGIEVIEEIEESIVAAHIRYSIKGIQSTAQAVAGVIVEAMIEPGARVEEERVQISRSRHGDGAFDAIVNAVDVVRPQPPIDAPMTPRLSRSIRNGFRNTFESRSSAVSPRIPAYA